MSNDKPFETWVLRAKKVGSAVHDASNSYACVLSEPTRVQWGSRAQATRYTSPGAARGEAIVLWGRHALEEAVVVVHLTRQGNNSQEPRRYIIVDPLVTNGVFPTNSAIHRYFGKFGWAISPRDAGPFESVEDAKAKLTAFPMPGRLVIRPLKPRRGRVSPYFCAAADVERKDLRANLAAAEARAAALEAELRTVAKDRNAKAAIVGDVIVALGIDLDAWLEKGGPIDETISAKLVGEIEELRKNQAMLMAERRVLVGRLSCLTKAAGTVANDWDHDEPARVYSCRMRDVLLDALEADVATEQAWLRSPCSAEPANAPPQTDQGDALPHEPVPEAAQAPAEPAAATRLCGAAHHDRSGRAESCDLPRGHNGGHFYRYDDMPRKPSRFFRPVPSWSDAPAVQPQTVGSPFCGALHCGTDTSGIPVCSEVCRRPPAHPGRHLSANNAWENPCGNEWATTDGRSFVCSLTAGHRGEHAAPGATWPSVPTPEPSPAEPIQVPGRCGATVSAGGGLCSCDLPAVHLGFHWTEGYGSWWTRPRAGDASAPKVPAAPKPPATFRVYNLEWQDEPPASSMIWHDATRYAAGLDLYGGGWRLPTMGELVALFDSNAPGVREHQCYWSSTPSGKSAFRSVVMSDGSIGWNVVSCRERVRCVRTAKSWHDGIVRDGDVQ